jgi:AraC-like DNA-binding protein
MERWRLSPRATLLVEQMLQPTPYDPFLQELRFEAQALDLLAEAFGRLAGSAASTSRGLSARAHRRLHAVRELVESEAANGLSIDDIARHAGSNVTTLQQQFRATFGTTIFAALRDARMRRATDALQAGASVSEAAYIAGFASPANFSTAFKARFGIPPKQARARG